MGFSSYASMGMTHFTLYFLSDYTITAAIFQKINSVYSPNAKIAARAILNLIFFFLKSQFIIEMVPCSIKALVI